MEHQQPLPFKHANLEEIIERDNKKAQMEAVCRAAHRAIHDKSIETVRLGGVDCNVYTSGNGCRAVVYRDITFMEQNKNKDSDTAKQAREGKRITWGLRFGPWIYIDDDIVRGV